MNATLDPSGEIAGAEFVESLKVSRRISPLSTSRRCRSLCSTSSSSSSSPGAIRVCAKTTRLPSGERSAATTKRKRNRSSGAIGRVIGVSLCSRERTPEALTLLPLDRLELLERLAAALAVPQRAARRRAEDVLELRFGRAAVGAAEDVRLQLDELGGRRLARCGRREACGAQLLAPCRGDPVGRPRVVRDHLDLGLGAELRDLLLHRPLHDLERGAAEEGRRELDADVSVRDIDRTDDAQVDERDDGDLRVRDLLERLPDPGLGYHCAPHGADRRTIVISSHIGASSSVCVPRSIASTSFRPTRVTSSPRSSGGRTPSAYGHNSSTAAWKRGSSRSRSCHISACMRWYASSRSIFAARPATAVSESSLSAVIRISSATSYSQRRAIVCAHSSRWSSTSGAQRYSSSLRSKASASGSSERSE